MTNHVDAVHESAWKFKKLEAGMSAASVARNDETYARLRAEMDLAKKKKRAS
jgi:hypothetical protein